MSASQVSTLPTEINPPSPTPPPPVVEQPILPPITTTAMDNTDAMDHEPSSPSAGEGSPHPGNGNSTVNVQNTAGQDEMQVDVPEEPQTATTNPNNTEPSAPAVGLQLPPHLAAALDIPIPSGLDIPIPVNNLQTIDRDIPAPPQQTTPNTNNLPPPPPDPTIPPPAMPDEEEDDFDGQAYFLQGFEEDKSEPPAEQLQEMSRQQNSGGRNFQRSGLDDDHWTKLVHAPVDDPAFTPGEYSKFTWHLEKFHGTRNSPSKERILRSPEFTIGGYIWNIKLFPHGCEGTDYVSVYLECKGPADPDLDPAIDSDPWDVAAQVGCVMYNPTEPRTHHFERASHHFERGNSDWGWVRFYGPWRELHMRRFLEYRPMLQNDKLSITAFVRVWQDPTRLLWSSNLKNGSWDSFARTGFRGLTMDFLGGHTAFTSAISLLAHSAFFNKLVADAPVDDAVRKPLLKRHPMMQELRRLLHLWHSAGSSSAGSLNAVSRLFSWYGYDFNSSTDVIEIWMALSQIIKYELEDDAKSLGMTLVRDKQPPAVEGAKVSVGKSDHKSVQEIFDNLHPDASVEALFTSGTIEDHTDSANESSQGAILDVCSRSNVIAVELNRAKFDIEKRKWSKLTHLIKLDPVIRVGNHSYSLVAAIVHRGELGSGDFYSVVRPQGSENWLKYRNGQVSFMTKKQAIDIHQGKGENKTGQDTVAYVVLYAREDIPNLFPSREIFNQATVEELDPKLPELKAEEPIPVVIHDSKNITKHHGIGFVDPWKEADQNLLTFNMRASATLADIQTEVLDRFKDSVGAEKQEQIRLWPIRTGHSAPRYLLELDDRWLNTRLSDLVHSNGGAHLWLKVIPVDQLETEEDSKTDPMAMSIASLQPPQPRTTNAEGSGPNQQDVIMANTEDEASGSDSEHDDDGEGDDDDDDDDGSSDTTHPSWELADQNYVILKTWNPASLQLACRGTYFVADRKQNVLEFVRATLKIPSVQRLKLYQETGITLETEIFPSQDFSRLDGSAIILIAATELSDKLQEQRRQTGAPATVVQWYKMQQDQLSPGHKRAGVVKDFYGGPYVQYSASSSKPRRKSVVVDTKGDAFVGDLDLNWGKNGNGTMIYTNGNKYEGEWKDDLPEGQGKMIYHPSGNRYEGGWRKGRQHGKGTTYHEESTDQLRYCRICYDVDMNTAFNKCGHIVACYDCARELKECPICRRPIQDVLRLWPTVES